MTISIQGHVENVSVNGSPPGKAGVTVRFAGGDCFEPVTFYVPNSDLQHWIVGSTVRLTAYAHTAARGET